MENKQLICKKLVPVLQLTRNLYDLMDLDYDPDKEIVTATYVNGSKKEINVRMDSGTAMIRDIILRAV
jgi:hypothetical protein